MKNDVLKTLALRAKNRLIHKNDPTSAYLGAADMRIKIIKSGDEVFYDKVKALLERDEDITNPLKELMDESLLSTMTTGQRERYLFQTIDKYQKLRGEWEEEKQLKLVY